MRSNIKLLSSGVAAALVLAIGVAGAQARRFELSSQTIRAIWTELPFILGESTPRCPVTLEGSFHSKTLSKVSGELVGYITRARTRKGAENCASNWGALFLDTEEGFAQTLPWHILYDSFEGTLPVIRGIRVQIIELSIRFREPLLGIRCLYKSLETQPLFLIFRLNAAGTVTGLQAEESEILWNSGETTCARKGRFLGTPAATVTPLERMTSAITVRLVQ